MAAIRKRPSGLLVTAILHFCVGGLLLICGVCGGAGAALSQSEGIKKLGQTGMDEKTKKQQKELQEKLQRLQEEHTPHALLVAGVQAGTQILFAAMLIIAGFGLLRMRPWARWLSIIYAVLALGIQLFMLVYSLLVTIPAQERMMKAFTEEATGPEKAMMESIGKFSSFLSGPMTIAVVVFWAIYPVAVLVIMFWPSITAAFRGEVLSPEPREDEWPA